MKKYQVIYKKKKGLVIWMAQIREYCEEHSIGEESVLFKVYSDSADRSRLEPVLTMIKEGFPSSVCVGTSTIGNIIHGSLTEARITITCNVFEDPESRIRVLQLPMTYDSQEETARTLVETVEENPWITAIEIMSTVGFVDMPAFCRDISGLPGTIHVYGGGAHAVDVSRGDYGKTFVFSGPDRLEKESAVFILMGGPKLHVSACYMTGWREIGRKFKVTSAEKNILKEVDGKPALEMYRHYMNLPTDDRFFGLINVFPLLFEENGETYLRVVSSHFPDGSLKTAAAIDRADFCRITYGDPVFIMEEVRRIMEEINAFGPQSIQIFSCASRKFFWGRKEVSRETLPFEMLAPTSGFFTSGEFLRNEEEVLLHNSTLVIVAMREGEADENRPPLPKAQEETFTRQFLVSNCLASFIQALEKEMNSQE